MRRIGCSSTEIGSVFSFSATGLAAAAAVADQDLFTEQYSLQKRSGSGSKPAQAASSLVQHKAGATGSPDQQ